MKLDIALEDLKLIRGDVLVDVPTLLSNEVKFNGATIQIVSKISDVTEMYDDKTMYELAAKIAKNPKDKEARKEYTRAMALASAEGEGAEDFQSKQARRRGILVKKPIKNDYTSGWDFKCELDCEIGDEVFWDSYYTKEQIEGTEDKIIEIEGVNYMLVPKNALFCAKKGEEYIGLNGHLIGKVLEPEQTGAIYIPQKGDVVRVEVVSPPQNYPEYLNPEVWGNTEVKKGDIVHVPNYAAIRLDSTISTDTDYVRVAVKMIIAVES